VASVGRQADRASVHEGLAAARYEGITGTIGFDDKGEYTGTGPYLYQVRGVEFAPLDGRISSPADVTIDALSGSSLFQ
jgi:hypothetical protein